jgi:SAM-dependent methyltransferase
MRDPYYLAARLYVQFIAPTFAPIARRVVELARPNTDDLHVDLATGTGLVPATADRRRTATCIWPWRAALDQSSEMLRAAKLAAPTTRLVQGDLDHLPFRDGSLDLVTLALALHHLPTARKALTELWRVLRPNGRLILAAWGEEPSPLWQAFEAWFERTGHGEDQTAARPDPPIDTVEQLESALRDVGGFGSAEVTSERSPLRFRTLADFWQWRISFPAPHRALSALSAAERARLREECLESLRPLVGGGEVRADQTVLFAVARP